MQIPIKPAVPRRRLPGRSGLIAMLLTAMITSGCTTVSRQSTLPLSEPWEAAPADRPPTASTLYRMARVLTATGKDAEAEAVLLSCRERYPAFRPAFLDLAGLYVRHGKLDGAIDVLEQGLQRAPRDPILRNDLGMCWLFKGRYQQALDEFALAADAAPDDARFRANQALAAGMLGRYDEALALYRQVMPAPEAHYNLALVCEARADHERAEQEYTLAGAARDGTPRKPGVLSAP